MIAVFLNFSIAPSFAETPEEEADRDKRQARAVLAAIGIVAIVGTLFMISKMKFSNSNDPALFEKKYGDRRLNLNLNFHQFDFSQERFSRQETFAPVLELKYSW